MQVSRFTEDFKSKAISAIGNKSVIDVAREMGCSISSLYNWKRENTKKERKLSGATKTGANSHFVNPEKLRLLKENERLIEEVTALKVILKSILN